MRAFKTLSTEKEMVDIPGSTYATKGQKRRCKLVSIGKEANVHDFRLRTKFVIDYCDYGS